MAYELVERLKQQSKTQVLNERRSAINDTEKKEGKLHKIFETSFKPLFNKTSLHWA